MIFDSSTSVKFVAIKSKKTISDLSYVIYTCSIGDLNHTICDFGTYLTWENAPFNPHADAVELAFVFIYIYKQQML